MRLHDEHKKLIIVVVFGLISFSVVGMGSLIQQQKNAQNAQAAGNTPAKCNCTDPNNCYPDGCSGKPKTPDNKLDGDRYDQVCKNINFGWPPDLEVQDYFCSIRQPDSCFDVRKYKDDRYACFMERWFCHPSLCEGAGGNGDCGKYWHLPPEFPNAYGCVKLGANGQTVPLWGDLPPNLPGGGGQQPTNTPQPQATATPQPQPTSTVPPNQPTSTVEPNQPTSTPALMYSPIPTTRQPTSTTNIEPSYNPPPTNPPLPTNTPYIFPTIDVKSPKELAREVINPESIQKLERSTEKVLNTPKEGLNTIKQADQTLERTAHSWIEKARAFIGNLLN
ncbi:MAG: hypothetical protein Q8P72_03750 [Candidatus Roizmanbacteria bacterium]|nr:hypothetical protein [Candidatus Roizmanbacteria bacterium]